MPIKALDASAIGPLAFGEPEAEAVAGTVEGPLKILLLALGLGLLFAAAFG